MTTIELILFLLGTFGLQQGLAYGEFPLIKWGRNKLIRWSFFKKLFECPLCLGFWCGLFLVSIPYGFVYLFQAPLAAGGFCLILHWLYEKLFEDS